MEETSQPLYDLFNLPPKVKIEYVKLMQKNIGHEKNFVYIIFKCKNNCTTILTPENIAEMDAYMAKLTQFKDWPKLCVRQNVDATAAADGYRCG